MSAETYEFFASCLSGMEGQLVDELKKLGAKSLRPLSGGVSFAGTARTAMAACLWSRLASRVTVVVARVDATDADTLYQGAMSVPWESVLAPKATIKVRAKGINDGLRNDHFTALRVKDALCDRLVGVGLERPAVSKDDPDVLVDVRVRDRKATLSVDLAGRSLFSREYLEEDASQDDVLACGVAASLLALVGWKDRCGEGWGLVDPACGDGALVTEAACMAADAAPGLTRPKWGFFGWAGFDEEAWAQLLDEADERFERGLVQAVSYTEGKPDPARATIVGLSASSPAIARGRDRIARAGVKGVASIVLGDGENADEALGQVLSSAGAETAVVACDLSRLERGESAARAQAEVSSFARTAALAPEGSVFAAAGFAAALAERFGRQPSELEQLGRGRMETRLSLFEGAPKSGCTIMIPDNAGGAEHPVEALEETTEQFASRLRKVAKQRRKWAAREGVEVYRIYDADLPDYAVAIDLYQGADHAEGNTYLHIAEYAPPKSVDAAKAARRFQDVLAVAPVVLGVRPDHVFSKTRQRERGGSQYAEAGRRPYVTCVREGGLLFEVDLRGYLDTGLFLDHRPVREYIQTHSAGKRFLNLFAYTGSATVHAAAGGASETVTVDLSQTYLDWARRNMELNGLEGPQHSFERGDVMAWVTECRRSPRRFDLVFVDVPTFSNSKAMGSRTWDVQRDHVELLIGVSRVLAEGGEAIFSCNLRTFKPDEEALAKYGVRLRNITAETIPEDFERNPRIHKTYVVTREK